MSYKVGNLLKTINLLQEIEGHLVLLEYNSKLSSSKHDLNLISEALLNIKFINSSLINLISKHISYIQHKEKFDESELKNLNKKMLLVVENISKTDKVSLMPSKEELLEVLNFCAETLMTEELHQTLQILESDDIESRKQIEKLRDLCNICEVL